MLRPVDGCHQAGAGGMSGTLRFCRSSRLRCRRLLSCATILSRSAAKTSRSVSLKRALAASDTGESWVPGWLPPNVLPANHERATAVRRGGQARLTPRSSVVGRSYHCGDRGPPDDPQVSIRRLKYERLSAVFGASNIVMSKDRAFATFPALCNSPFHFGARVGLGGCSAQLTWPKGRRSRGGWALRGQSRGG